MRVCLINPPCIKPKSWGKPTVFQPLTIAYTAAVLEKRHEVCIIDAPTEGRKNVEEINGTKYRVGLSNKEIAGRIEQYSPDVVGISVPFSGWSKTAFEVAAVTKEADKKIVTVLDGQHPSARPEDYLSDPNVDFVIIGEAELTMLELVDTLKKKAKPDLKKIQGIAFIKKGKMIVTSPRPAIEDLNSLPLPARHLLPMEEYFAAIKEYPLAGGEMHERWATMTTSRGCPYNCVFCSIHTVMGKKWRCRSPESVVDEIEHLVRIYKIKQIDFFDDNMTLDKERMENICDLIVKRGLDIEWYTPNGVRADTLDENLLTKMKTAGCKKIKIAPESGVQRVVNQIIKKNQNLEDVEKAVVLSKKVGIEVGCFFVIGLIGETKEDIEATINYAYKLKRLGAERFYFSVATPLYGTELYDQAKRGGFLSDKFSDEALAAGEPLIITPEFTPNDMRELCARANLVNPTFTRDRLARAVRDPSKAIKILFRGGKMSWRHRHYKK
jgi:anaerobic magnesium-protoporphyrin IX monomethyl ester cyclase